MQFFKTPFSAAYWKTAAGELKKPRMIVIAALIVAVRVALKSISIPVGDNLSITVGFFANALGSAIYGPIVAALSGAVSDVLGYILTSFKSPGPFFPPFTFVEMLGSFLFAIFLYRAKLTPMRAFLSMEKYNQGLSNDHAGWYNKPSCCQETQRRFVYEYYR